jgi:DNA-binding NarL/FixJ family response regulator
MGRTLLPDPDKPSAPISILIVDDNADVGAAMERWFKRSQEFRSLGWLGDANKLETSVAQLAPDVVLVDWSMPGIDTAALLSRLVPKFPSVRFAVLSAHSDFSYVNAALKSGARGFISKNQSPAHIAADVRMLTMVAPGAAGGAGAAGAVGGAAGVVLSADLQERGNLL